MISILLVITLLVAYGIHYWYSGRRYRYLGSKLPGPSTVPLFGNALLFIGAQAKMFRTTSSVLNSWAPFFRLWFGPYLVVGLTDPRDIEIVLRNTEAVHKGWIYNFLKPWLGNGLVTGSGEHWYKHRKLITPTFHFKILEQFVPIFEANCNILIEKLKKTESTVINVAEYLELYSMDTICETAMGFQPNSQTNQHSPYVESSKKLSEIAQMRMVKLWLYSDFLFRWTPQAKELEEALKVVHGISTQIVLQKMEQLNLLKSQGMDLTKDESTGEKKKMVFLDHLLLNSTALENPLTVQEIREEVDTFLFAGHDTTTSLVSFCLFLLGIHQSIQEEAYQEIQTVLGDSERSITFSDLCKFKHIERCLLETLRIYPTIPIITRISKKELKLREHTLPVGCIIAIFIMKLHKNPDVFPEPSKFNPDRFLSEGVSKRHPYSFIPFSAGPRNCIGQKYGILQAKFLLATILRHFHVSPGCKRKDIVFISNIVSKSANGIPIMLTSRHKLSNQSFQSNHNCEENNVSFHNKNS